MNPLRLIILSAALLAGTCFAQDPAVKPQSLYERLAKKIAPQQPPPELDTVRWMIGRWSVNITVYATASTPAVKTTRERTTQADLRGYWLASREGDRGYERLELLGYDPVEKTWVSGYFDSSGTLWGDPLTSRAGWQDGNLVLTGESTNILGENIEQKQVITKISDERYQVIHEERRANGEWLSVDEYQYTKKTDESAKDGGSAPAGTPTSTDEAGSTSTERTIVDSEDAFDRAWLKGDRGTLERLIADDFVGVGSTLYNKAHLIEVAARMEESATERTERNVRVFGNVAIARSLVTDHGVRKSSRQPYTASTRVTDVWVLRSGAWQLVAAQESVARSSP